MNASIINKNHIKAFFESLTAIRKVSSDIIFCCTPSFLSVRALNSSQTSLPVLIFKESFFGDYMYTSDRETLSFQIDGQCIKFIKRIKDVSNISITYNPDDDSTSTKVYFELIGRYDLFHKFEFFTSEASVFDAVQNNDSLLLATVNVDELYAMRNSFKCPYIILTYKVGDDEIPFLSFESFNSADTAKQSLYTVKHSHLCNIKTNNECRVIISYADFIQSVKIAKATGEFVEISAGNPGTAFIMRASNGHGSLKLMASLATLADDDFITSSLSSQASTFSATQSNKNKPNIEEEEQIATSLSPPESPLRVKHSVKNETRLNETGRLSSSNNSQYATSTQVVPWKNDSDDFSASPEFPSKRKHSDVVIAKSQPTDDDYNDDEDEEAAPAASNNRIF